MCSQEPAHLAEKHPQKPSHALQEAHPPNGHGSRSGHAPLLPKARVKEGALGRIGGKVGLGQLNSSARLDRASLICQGGVSESATRRACKMQVSGGESVLVLLVELATWAERLAREVTDCDTRQALGVEYVL